MGPTYLVILRSGDAALILYDGTDKEEAEAAHTAAYREHRGKPQAIDAKAAVYLVTVRSEAHLK